MTTLLTLQRSEETLRGTSYRQFGQSSMNHVTLAVIPSTKDEEIQIRSSAYGSDSFCRIVFLGCIFCKELF